MKQKSKIKLPAKQWFLWNVLLYLDKNLTTKQQFLFEFGPYLSWFTLNKALTKFEGLGLVKRVQGWHLTLLYKHPLPCTVPTPAIKHRYLPSKWKEYTNISGKKYKDKYNERKRYNT